MEPLSNQSHQIYYHNLLRARHFNPAFYLTSTPDILLSEPEYQSGYHFLGWYNSPTGNNKIIQIPHSSAGDINLYARWEPVFCTLSYYANDSTQSQAINVPNAARIREGESILISDCIPARPGYRFLGWNTSPDGDGISWQPGYCLRNLFDNLSLYCQWSTCLSE